MHTIVALVGTATMGAPGSVTGDTLFAAPEHAVELPAPPIVIGIGTFVALCALIGMVLAIGKGRPHV